METKSLIFGIVGFIAGGLLVSIAATTFEKPKDMTTGMTASLQGKTGDAFDEAFVGGMITHHQDAIDMARMADSQAKHQEVKDLSKAIIEAQQKEIDQMKEWQKDWGYAATSGHSMSE